MKDPNFQHLKRTRLVQILLLPTWLRALCQEDPEAVEAHFNVQTTASITPHCSLLRLMFGLNWMICSALIFQQHSEQRKGFLPGLWHLEAAQADGAVAAGTNTPTLPGEATGARERHMEEHRQTLHSAETEPWHGLGWNEP